MGMKAMNASRTAAGSTSTGTSVDRTCSRKIRMTSATSVICSISAAVRVARQSCRDSGRCTAPRCWGGGLACLMHRYRLAA